MSLKQIFREKGVVWLISLTAVIMAVFVGTLCLASHISQRELQKQAFEQYRQDASTLKSVSEMMCLSAIWISGTFLSDFVTCEYQKADSVSVDYVNRLKQDAFDGLDACKIYSRMESFLSYNSEYSTVCCIFEPSVLHDAPNGLAACIVAGDTLRYDLLELFESGIYREVSSSRFAKVLCGTAPAGAAPQMFFCIPMLDENNIVQAQLWVGYEITAFFYYVGWYQAEGDDYDFVISDSDGNLIYSPGKDVYGQHIADLLPKMYHNYPEDFCERLLISLKKPEKSLFKTEYSGKRLATYVFPIRFMNLRLIKTYKESTILRKAHATITSVAVWSVTGILLIFLLQICIFTRFYKQQKAKNRMKNELDVAEHIQKSILPVNGEAPLPPNLDIYGFQKSARVIGGDLFDYTIKDGKLYFCIGDVSGDGIPAALMMTEICSLVRHIAKTESDPAAILSVLNSTALDSDENRMFCTMFAAVLDPQTGELVFCNAGHCRPVVIRNGKPVMLTMKANMPVYAFDTYPYQNERMRLEPCDVVLLYTDGVTEARNSASKFFGSDRLLSVLSAVDVQTPAEIVSAVCKSIDTFCGSSEQHDDITMLCIKFKEYENQTL